jgi:hypothetical protein
MVAITSTADIASTFRPGIKFFLMNYSRYSGEFINQIYTHQSSEKNYELLLEIQGLGLADEIPEGMPTIRSGIRQTGTKQLPHVQIRKGFSISEIAIADNLYTEQFGSGIEFLKTSIREKKNTMAAEPFNQAFSGSTQFLMIDGQPLLSTKHNAGPGGYFANTLGVNADLNESSLEQHITMSQLMRDRAGLLTRTKITDILVHPQMEFTTTRLLQSFGRTNTANNDINAVKADYGFRVITCPYLDNFNSYFFLTDLKDKRVNFEREPLKVNVYAEETNRTINIDAAARLSYWILDPRAVLGSKAPVRIR